MVGAFIIILSLFIAFSEKPHLFTRPINSKKILIVTTLISIAIFSAFKENYNDIEQDRNAKTIDSLNGRSKTLSEVIDSLRAENKIAQQDFIVKLDSSHQNTVHILAMYGLQVDTLTNTIKKLDNSILKETPPTLRIIEPIVEDLYAHKEKVLSFGLQALNADVHILDYRYIFLPVVKGKFEGKPIVVQGGTMNYTTIIAANELLERTVFLDRITGLSDSFFVAIECIYKSKGNKVQVPLRNIYLASKLMKSCRETANQEHLQVSLILRKNKIWEKFYDL